MSLVLYPLIDYDKNSMTWEVAITKIPEAQTDKFPIRQRADPKFTIRSQKPRRFSAFLMIGAGVLILSYLSFTFIFGKRQTNSSTAEELQEVLGIGEEKKSNSHFGELLDSKQPTANRQPPTTNQPDPALHITQTDLNSFGKILGLKQNQPVGIDIPAEFSITIPALGVKDAKVLTNVDGTNESTYQKALEAGIAHFAGSALPGEYGNVFLFGHSMIPILARGTYLSIFTNLPKLKRGDVVFVEYGNENLRYLIEQTAVVNPKDVFVLRQPKNEELITLMTCIPPGFGSDRFVAIAKRD